MLTKEPLPSVLMTPGLLSKPEISSFTNQMNSMTIKSIGKDSPNLVVMSFTCDSPAMDFFIRRNFTLSMEERSLILQIITEARQTFSTPMHIPSVEQVELKRQYTVCFTADDPSLP